MAGASQGSTMVSLAAPTGTLIAIDSYTHQLREFIDSLPQLIKRERFDELRQRCAHLLSLAPEGSADEALKPAYARLAGLLEDLRRALETRSQVASVRVEELSRSYEQWLISVRARAREAGESRPTPTALKPLIKARTSFHIAMGLLATVMYQFVLTKWQAVGVLGTLLGIFSFLEISRRFSPRWNHLLLSSPIFRPIARPEEYFKINSSTYYLIALFVVTPVFSRPAVLVGILVLAFADPAAAWIGKRFGKRKLFREKSWLGTAAFLVTAFAVSLAFLLLCYPSLDLSARILGALLASTAGALAELLSTRLDDNLTVPIASVLAAALIL
jgi:dolichol kinase